MTRNLTTGLQRGLRQSIAGGLGAGDIFSTASLDLNFARHKNLDSRITFSRASSGTYVDAGGVIRTAGNNVPRFDHNPTTGESLGLLVEESRTNRITNSDLLSNFNNVSAGSFTTVTETAPNNGTQALQIVADSSNSKCRIKFPASSGNNITVSAFVKKDTHRYVQVGFGGPNNNFAATFDIEPGVTNRLLSQGGFGTFTNIDAGYQDYANGWVRIWAVGTTTGIDGPGISIVEDGTKTSFGDNNVYSGTESIYVWGAQYEDNVTFPTSYIRTEGSTVTRSADVTSIEGNDFGTFYNQTEGSLAITNTNAWVYPGSNVFKYLAQFDRVSSSSNFRIAIENGTLTDGQRYLLSIQDNGVAQVSSQLAYPLTENTSNNVAIAYAVNNCAGTVNGGTVITDTTATIPSSLDRLKIGEGTGGQHTGTIARLTYWPTRLSNDTLQTITV